MAISVTDKYLNFIFSLMISNRSKTNFGFVLPDDFRKLEDIKIKDSRIKNFTVAAGATYQYDIFDPEMNFFFIVGSHPFSVTRLNYATISRNLYTSFFAVGRDRPGDFNLNIAPFLEISNNLHTPDYDSTFGGATTDLEVVSVELSIEQ